MERNYLKKLKHRLFGKKITDCKKGDIVVFVGGYSKNGTKIAENKHGFTVGKEYVSREDYNVNKAGTYYHHISHNNETILGTIRIEEDDTGVENGWGASLFELK
ncbi:MAG: hypothetical protein DRP57_04325 [Spirochaetes bacterium]|nr:MAG: hypothetical protein DRP57_04325 [Spirochaetota bacterium]